MTGIRTRVAPLVLLLAVVALAASAATALAARPPAPGHVLAAGHVPAVCNVAAGEGDTADGFTYGWYWAGTTRGWVSAPRCFPQWGNLTMSAPQIVAAGSTVTMTAIPDTNSAQYAPETGTISWRAPGTPVSGCGSKDLTCTVRAPKATPAWQWLEFQVSMPRIFYVDSPGSNCAGQHLCAGFTTHAWSAAGVAPTRELQVGTLVAELPPTLGPGPVDFPTACPLPQACEVKVDATVPGSSITIQQQIIDAQNRQNHERWNQRQTTQQQVRELQDGVTNERLKRVEKSTNKYLDAIKASTDVPGQEKLQLADAGLEPIFPAAAASAASTPALLRPRSPRAAATFTDAGALVRALTRPAPTAADLRELRIALLIARGASYSPERAQARIMLSVALEAGRIVLSPQLRAPARAAGTWVRSATIGSTSRRIAAGGRANLRLTRTQLGRRLVRFIETARGNRTVMATVAFSSMQGGRTSAARARVEL